VVEFARVLKVRNPTNRKNYETTRGYSDGNHRAKKKLQRANPMKWAKTFVTEKKK